MERIDKTFDRCPNCGSDKRFFESLVKVAKERHLVKEDWAMYYRHATGVILDKSRALIMPIGSRAPSYETGTDICIDCGTEYAVLLRTGEVVLQADIPQGG